MNSRLLSRPALALACLAALCACQTAEQPSARLSRAELEQQLTESRELVTRYEKRYGRLLPARPAHDFRRLREQLKGKPGTAVVALLGKPAKAYSLGTTESWDYINAAYDPVSGRTVKTLEVWFRNGVVAYMNAAF